MCSLCNNTGINSIQSDSLAIILNMGLIVIGLFAVVFLFYTNSFLMKRRKKEIGLYNILGMGKRHISKVLFWETTFVGIASLIIGLLTGILLDKLVLMILMNLLAFEQSFEFSICIPAILFSCALFGVIFLMELFYNLFRIHISKPIELLKGGNTGEKEPKTKWILTIIGIICLGIGYYIAISTESPLAALNSFFIAVILVIFGTYCLFIAVSIFILKMLRKNKGYYYETKHFISVSGMIYRMKQNAVGLANICILSTMVLVMISTTVCLYAGADDSLNKMFKGDINLEYGYKDPNAITDEEIYKSVTELSKSKNNVVKDFQTEHYLIVSALKVDDGFSLDRNESIEYNPDDIANIYFITEAEYNKHTGEDLFLKQGECAYYSNKHELPSNTSFGNINLNTEVKLDKPIEGISESTQLIGIDSYIIVAKDQAEIDKIYSEQYMAYGENASTYHTSVSYNINGNSEEKKQYSEYVWDIVPTENEMSFSSKNREEGYEELYSLYGGFLFIGVFLGMLFMMATVLIIYYKQISEGYEDKERYEIMQKVGLSKKEIKKSINSQILIVFFMPIIIALIHLAFSFPLISKLLAAVGLSNVSLFLITTIVTALVFCIIYGFVYFFTSKIYYKIVQKN